jgi:hypothetical protein
MPFDPAAQTPSIRPRFTTDPPNFRDTPIAELIVTEQRTSFLVHKNLLCDAAPFFDAALTTGFVEATKQQILLPEDDADTVHRFVQRVYFKSYGLPKDHAEQFMQLARLYVFANKVLAWHVDLAWYGKSLGKEALEMVPAFTVELTSRLAERIRTNKRSPFRGKEELYFESTEGKS